MLTVQELAKLLHVSPSTVYAMVASGAIACHRVRTRPDSRGTIRFTDEQVRAYLDEVSLEEGRAEPRPSSAKSSFSQLDADRLRQAWAAQGIEPPS
jgi:excisionase family DNA binding protein